MIRISLLKNADYACKIKIEIIIIMITNYKHFVKRAYKRKIIGDMI